MFSFLIDNLHTIQLEQTIHGEDEKCRIFSGLGKLYKDPSTLLKENKITGIFCYRLQYVRGTCIFTSRNNNTKQREKWATDYSMHISRE
jgi:hypothetical protein